MKREIDSLAPLVRAVDSVRFATLWALESTALRYSAIRGVHHVLPPVGKLSTKYLTIIARLPEPVTTALSEVTAELKLRNSAHYYYPPETMHFTLQNLDDVRWRCSDHFEWLAQLRSDLQSYQPFVVRARGLGVSSSTVFVQLFPENNSISELRYKLLGGRSALRGFRTRAFRHLSFANIVRFSGPISLPFVQEVARRYAFFFGGFTIRQLEVVLTDKVLSAAGTQTIDHISLGNRAPPA